MTRDEFLKAVVKECEGLYDHFTITMDATLKVAAEFVRKEAKHFNYPDDKRVEEIGDDLDSLARSRTAAEKESKP